MKKTALVFLLLFPVLLPARSKLVGYYDLDSVITSVPTFKRISDSLESIRTFLSEQREKLVTNMNFKLHDAGQDSANWTPIIKSLKLSEIVDMRINLQHFDTECAKELLKIDQCFVQKITDVIQSCINSSGVKKNYIAVLEKDQPNYISNDQPSKCVTQEIVGMALLLTE